MSPRAIAAGLNADFIAAPRGPHWNSSTINGNAKRRNGILKNPIYSGKNIWNRVRMVKDPSTGRRVSRINPENEWQSVEVEKWRIVDQVTFDGFKSGKRQPGLSSHAARRAPNESYPVCFDVVHAVGE
jgi:site-specific DNA recombinase